MTQSDTGRRVKATVTSFDIVETIQQLEGATLSELARRLDLAKSTVQYHLQSLQDKGYIVKEGTGYYLSLRFYQLGQEAKNRNINAITVAKVNELAQRINGEADFSVEEFGQIILLYNRSGTSADPGFTEGAQHNMHTNAAGKAILAEWPDEKVHEVIDEHGLTQRTENTVSSREELFAELEQIRAQGYAINDEEYTAAHRSVSAVVHRPDGSVYGALSLAGPSYRVGLDMLRKEYRVAVVQTVDELEENLATSAMV